MWNLYSSPNVETADVGKNCSRCGAATLMANQKVGAEFWEGG